MSEEGSCAKMLFCLSFNDGGALDGDGGQGCHAALAVAKPGRGMATGMAACYLLAI